MVTMKFEGGAELAKALEGLSARVSKRMLREALEDAAEPMRRSMAAMAPREPGAPDLADHIVISTARVKKVAGDESQSAAVAVGPAREFYYGLFQEFGTSFHGAQPFVRPAFDGAVSRTISEMARALWTALAARGISRSATSDAPIQGEGRFL